jgi:outer membrane immunogenic protein
LFRRRLIPDEGRLAIRTVAIVAAITEGGSRQPFVCAGCGGAHGWSDQARASIGGIAVSASSNDLNGGFGGGTVGYNQQMGSWVIGIEADAAWSDLKYLQSAFVVTLADKLQSSGSATGRIGYVPAAPILLYLKGGYAWADNEISATGFGDIR